MKPRSVLQVVLFAVAVSLLGAQDERTVPGKRNEIRFTESPVQSSDAEQVKYRLMAAETPPPYDVSKEAFEILLPAKWKKEDPHGLFIWIGAGPQPSIPQPWEEALARPKL